MACPADRIVGGLLALTVLIGCGGSSGSTHGSDAGDAGVEVGEDTGPSGCSETGVCAPAAPELLAVDCPTQAGPEGVCAPEPRRADPACPTELSEHGICGPASPRLEDWPCPEGWASEPASMDPRVPTYAVCVPPEVPSQCQEGLWPRAGAQACASVGDPCPEGWPTAESIRARVPAFDGTLVYIQADADGDGTRDAPFGSLGAAQQELEPGDILAVRGALSGEVGLAGVALVGTCASESVLTGAVSLAQGAALTDLTIDGAVDVAQGRLERVVVRTGGIDAMDAELRDVVVADVEPGGARNGNGITIRGTTQAERVTVWRATNIGVHVLGAAEISDLLVADTRPIDAAPFRGRGVQVEGAAVFRRTVLVRNRNSAVFAIGDAEASFEDAYLAETRGDEAAGTFGDGVTAAAGASVTLRRAVLRGNRNSGVTAIADGAQLHLEQVVISDTANGAVNGFGDGIHLEESGQVSGHEVLLVGNHGSGIAAFQEGTQVELTDLVVAATLPNLEGAFGRGIGLQEGSVGRLERVLLIGNTEAGIYMSGPSELSAVDLAVRSTGPDPSTGEFGYALNVGGGASASVSRCTASASTASGVVVGDPGTRLTLTDCRVDGTRASDAGDAAGVTVQTGGRLEAERLALVGNEGVSLTVLRTGAEVVGSDILIADGVPRQDGLGGRGMEIGLGGRANLARLEIRDCRELGVFVDGSGSALELLDGTVTGIEASEAGLGGRALNVQDGARLQAQRLHLADNRDAAIFAAGRGTEARLEDAVALRTGPDAAGEFGRGVVVQGEANLALSRGVVRASTESGVFVSGGVLAVEDARIEQTTPDARDRWGRGIAVQDVGEVTLARVQIADNHDVGLFVHGTRARVTGSDVSVARTAPQVSDGDYGRGIGVQAGARLDIRRLRLLDNHQVGLLAISTETVVQVQDLEVDGVAAAACEPSCASGAGGTGVALLGAQLRIERFHIRDCELAGMQLGPSAGFEAMDGLITSNRIGLNVLDAELDLGASFTRVRVRDNETDRDLGERPVPSAAGTLEMLTDAR